MGTLLQDLRYGIRQLARNPGFTAVAVLTLALGIGANTAVFSLLDAVLLRPLPYSHQDHLFRLYPTDKSGRHAMEATSYPDFEDWKGQSHTFEAMAAYYQEDFNLTGTGQPERLRGLRSTPGLFAMLGVHPLFGREFVPGDGQRVALLSYRLWQRRFAADPKVVGKPIHLDGWAYTVLGVLPRQFYFPPQEFEGELTAEVFVPAVPNPDRGWHYVRVIGRIAPGVTSQQAQIEMNGIAARLVRAYPKADHGGRITFGRHDRVAVSGMRETAWMLFGAVAFVLLIACANVANLLLARGTAREHEIAIRSIVGATRLRILRQLLTEGLMLAALGGTLGIGLAEWALPLLAYMVPQNTMFFTRVHDVGIHLNAAVLLFSAVLVVLSTVLFGVFPAWKVTRPVQSPQATLRMGRMRGALIGFEVALCLVLLAGAGLMMRSLIHLRSVDVGFRTSRLLTLDVSLPGKKYDSGEKQAAFFEHALAQLASLPSVASAGAVTDMPMTRSSTWNSFDIPGAHSRRGVAGYHAVSPDYFRTMGIPLLSGRELLDSDLAHSPLVGVISWRMAQQYWPNQNSVGQSITVNHAVVISTPNGTSVQFKPQQLEIVGVVGDVRQLGLDTPPGPELYIPYAQWPSDEMSLVLRTKSEPALLIPKVEKTIWSVDPDQPVTAIKTMDQWVSKEAASRQFVLQLIGVFALIAMVLAAIGIYGVVSYWMRQRTREIGIRMALGAERRDVLKMVIGQGFVVGLTGTGLGIIGALVLTRFLSSLLYGVSSHDPFTYVCVAILITGVTFLASYFPARRASKVDPMEALRYE
jgi:putative ABC transport system permease protein